MVFTTAVLSLPPYLGSYQILSCLSYLSRLVIYLWPQSLSSCVPSALLSGEGLKHCCLSNSRSVASIRPWTVQRQLLILDTVQEQHQKEFLGMIRSLEIKCGLLWFILNIDDRSQAMVKDNLLCNGIPFLSRLYLTLLFFCKSFDPDQIKELWFDLITICDEKYSIKDFLLFVVIFNYREFYSTWQCNI